MEELTKEIWGKIWWKEIIQKGCGGEHAGYGKELQWPDVLGKDGREGRPARERLGVGYRTTTFMLQHDLSLYLEESTEPWHVTEWWHDLTCVLKGLLWLLTWKVTNSCEVGKPRVLVRRHCCSLGESCWQWRWREMVRLWIYFWKWGQH